MKKASAVTVAVFSLTAILTGCGDGGNDVPNGDDGNGHTGYPTIGAVSGTIAHGSAVTLRGSGFGAKPRAEPAAFWQGKTADLNGLTEPIAQFSHIIDTPQITGQQRGQEKYNIRFNPTAAQNQFVAGFSYGHNNPVWFIQYWIRLDDDWHWGTTGSDGGDPRWANTKIFRMWPMPDGNLVQKSNVLSAVGPGNQDLFLGTEGHGGDDGSNDPSNQIRGWPGTLPGGTGGGRAIAASSSLSSDVLCMERGLIWKVIRAGTCGASRPVFGNRIGDTVRDNGVVWMAVSSVLSYWTTDGTCGTEYYNLSNRITTADFYRLMSPGCWHLLQVEYQESSANNMPDGRIHMWFDGKKVFTHDSFITSWAADGPELLLKGPCLIGIYDSWAEQTITHSSFIWLQDVYVDTTWARVEIGDSANYDSCTHREMQAVTAWNDGAVTVTFNQGSFPSGATVYAFVVDSAGYRNAEGYPISIGE